MYYGNVAIPAQHYLLDSISLAAVVKICDLGVEQRGGGSGV